MKEHSPEVAIPKLQVSKELFHKRLKPITDFTKVPVQVWLVEGRGKQWKLLLAAEDQRFFAIPVTIAEATYITPFLHGLTQDLIYPSTYHIITRLVAMLGGKIEAVTFHAGPEDLLTGNVEISLADKGQLFIKASPGDAIAIALCAQAPIFATESLLSHLSED